MHIIGKKITDNYGFEITILHKLREFYDGISFFKGKINWDRYKSDHSPKFELFLMLFNYTIVELNIYYLHHRT